MEGSDLCSLVDDKVEFLDSLTILESNFQHNMDQIEVRERIKEFQRNMSEIENSVDEIGMDLADTVRKQ